MNSTPPYSELLPFVGTIVAALIAAAVAYLATVLTKEQKVSEFRQAWIDALRNDISELISLVLLTDDVKAYLAREGRHEEVPKYIIDHHEDFAKLTACAVRIELRMNPVEDADFLLLVRAVGTAPKNHSGDTDATVEQAHKLLEASQVVLKREWRRVKRGELVYLLTKWTSLALLVLAAVAVMFLAYRSFVAANAL